MRWLLTLLIASVLAATADAQLIAFVSSKNAPVSAEWKQGQLPFLEELAQEQGVELRVIDVAEQGAPQEVGITPLLAFQNHRGRSIYQGRSSNRTRIANFVRTSRVIPQSSEPWIRTQIPVWKCERTQVAAPLKVTGLAGSRAEDHSDEDFLVESEKAILAGFERFQLSQEVRFERSDRTFYFDFYPYRDEADQFFVSVALFSQFHCKEAIFESDEAFVGAWTDRSEVFARAAQRLEKEAVRLMRESTLGDAFDCVPSSIAVTRWDALGLELPAAPEGFDRDVAVPALGRAWQVAEARESSPPRVLFRFPPPLDGTAGEVGKVAGALLLSEGASIQGAKGEVTVEVDSITLGVDDLDQVVKSVVMLDAKSYPQASFILGDLISQEGSFAFGHQTRTILSGAFHMKGKETPIEVSAIWEPIVNEQGEARLLVDGAFSIRLLEPFGIKGPDGPSPARDTLLFHFALELEPQ